MMIKCRHFFTCCVNRVSSINGRGCEEIGKPPIEKINPSVIQGIHGVQKRQTFQPVSTPVQLPRKQKCRGADDLKRAIDIASCKGNQLKLTLTFRLGLSTTNIHRVAVLVLRIKNKIRGETAY